MKKTTSLLLTFVVLSTSGIIFADDEPLFRSQQRSRTVKVIEVRQADFIVVEGKEKVRLIGIKAPEPPEKESAPERNKYGFVPPEEVSVLTPIENLAFEFATELLQGQNVRLEFDKQRKGDQFETLAYVFLDDNTFINAEILRQGYATLKLSPPNLKHSDKLREAYREARSEKRGLHGE